MSKPDTPAVDPLPTHSHVMHALYALDDYDAADGIAAISVVEHVVERTGLEAADVRDAIGYLTRHGEIYAPRPDHLRRTQANDDRWERFGTACHWQKALVEVKISVGRGLKPHELVTRYDVQDPDRIEELVTRGMVEVKLHDENEKLTLEDIDQAAERMDVPRIVCDGGIDERRTTRDERRDDWPPFVDATAEVARCHFCGQTWEPSVVDGFDLSGEDEYYPRMVPVCREHAGGCR